jgi:hypothetical protein
MRFAIPLRSFTLVTVFAVALAVAVAPEAGAQRTPLISGGVGMFTLTNGGNTTYIPTIAPVLEAPIGRRVLVEAKANLLESAFPRPGLGYDTSHYVALGYLQADVFVNRHATFVGGYFYTPFGTYLERLSPIWIQRFTDGPLTASIGTVGSGVSSGAMVRGNAYSTRTVSVDYALYVSAKNSWQQFPSTRSFGGRVEMFLPKPGLEIGMSANSVREGAPHPRNFGAHVWWTPATSGFQLRSEYGHTREVNGYWVETDYRLSRFGGAESWLGRTEPVFRWQQVFRNSPNATDGLPPRDTQRADFGLDYHLPHTVRLNASYSRQFAAGHNVNIWETGLVYRFLFPAWKGNR